MDEEATTFRVERGVQILTSAHSAMASLKAGGESPPARKVLAMFASAMNWLEGTPHFESAHKQLHEAGRYVRQSSPSSCRLERNGTDFQQTCPVEVAHKRFGFSPRMTANAICSICASDITTCDHRRGAEYRVPAGTTRLGWCNVCADQNCEEHEPGIVYRTRANVVVTEVYEIIEISIVPIPQQPDARLAALPVSRSLLEESYGGPIPDEVDVTCNACHDECPGLDYLDGPTDRQ